MTFYVYNMMEELLGTVTAACWEDAMDKVWAQFGKGEFVVRPTKIENDYV